MGKTNVRTIQVLTRKDLNGLVMQRGHSDDTIALAPVPTYKTYIARCIRNNEQVKKCLLNTGRNYFLKKNSIMELYSIDKDEVIKAYFLTGRVTYRYAVDNLISIINKLDIQRKFQDENFYRRLEVDFQKGCITPAITIAFVKDIDINKVPPISELKPEIEASISEGFILDGIQRLNTLKRLLSKENTLDENKHLYINVIICPSRDNLLYRMVTLNNGQKPMTARHQIEILAESMYNFKAYSFSVITEKEQPEKGDKFYKKADIMNAYISFLSNSVSLDNKIIIESKLDELVARKIIESKIPDEVVDFSQVLSLVERMTTSDPLYEWLKNGNNLIGFVVGLRTSFESINSKPNSVLEGYFRNFEAAFKNMNVSKIKLSRERRKMSLFFVSHIDEVGGIDTDDLTLSLAVNLGNI